MATTRATSEFVVTDDGVDLCPECRHIWTDNGPHHYPDCRYYYVDLQELDEE